MNRRNSIQLPDVPAGHCRERGFALLEVLIAFVILALGLGAISTGIALAMRSDGRTQTSRAALRIAQSRLETAGISELLAPGRREGRVGSSYKWQEKITAVHIGAEPAEVQGGNADQTAAKGSISPFWVEVAVQAPDGSVARVAGLKLALEQKP
jgi:type II secretory pathway pseudopilin PulG